MLLLLLSLSLLILCDSINDYYYNNWCGGSLKYLDDSDCIKVFPSNNNRQLTCNTNILDGKIDSDNEKIASLLNQGYYYDTQKLSDVSVDVNKLSSIVTNDANICVIITKRISNYNNNDDNIQLINKYYCAGNHSRDDAFETWSSSKIFAIANGAGRLRSNETNCHNDVFGLTSNTTGKNGITPLADLATIICSYDKTKGYSSNSLASYFHDLGWREELFDLINSNWIGATVQTLGGNYGEPTPDDLLFKINNLDQSCNADKDPWPNVYSNTISSLTAAELTRRIALHREIKVSLRFPGLLDVDAINLLNGAEKSSFFPNQVNGGMSTDTSIFVQSSLDMKKVEADSNGEWRIYSKLGNGWSSSRGRGEIVNNAYVCLPQENGQGLEFTINVRGSVVNDYSTSQAESKVLEAMTQTISAIINGILI